MLMICTKSRTLFTGAEHDKLQKVIERQQFLDSFKAKGRAGAIVVKAAIVEGDSANTIECRV